MWAKIFTHLFEFQCYTYKENKNYQTGLEYNYNICLFEQITQSYALGDDSSDSSNINLGSWDGQMIAIEEDDLLVMHYDNGSTEWCADGNTTFARDTDIYHFCGSSNHIVSVHETTECSYNIVFSVNCTVDNY